MIRHIVFFELAREADGSLPAGRLGSVLDSLKALGTIPGVRTFEVAPNQGSDPRSDVPVDVVVHATLDDWAALDAYRGHPTYHQAIQAVRPLRNRRWAVDYETA